MPDEKPMAKVVKSLQQLSPMQVPQDTRVKNKFESMYQIMHRMGPKEANMFYEQERFFFTRRIEEDPKLQRCTRLSLYGAFLEAPVNGLSFDPSMNHMYLYSRRANVGTKEKEVWEDRAVVQITAPGELILRAKQGQIKYANNPVVVYEGDVFRFITADDTTKVYHEAIFPRKSEKMVACFIKIVRNDGSTDYKVLSFEELMQLKSKSKQPNSLGWSAAGLRGMFETKTLRHAFKSYPKLRLGDFAQLASMAEELPDVKPIDYSLEEGEGTKETPALPNLPAQEAKKEEPAPQEQVTEDIPFEDNTADQNASDDAKKIKIQLTSSPDDQGDDSVF